MTSKFRKNGYATFENALSADDLSMLRGVCDTLVAEPLEDVRGTGKHDINIGEARRFLAHRHGDFPDLERFVLGETMGRIARECLGAEPMLFNEQFVVKGAKKGASFAWHQDSAYVGYDHPAYLTVWIALDDATEENGCVYLIPRDLDEAPGIDHHEWVEESKELNGYFGSETGTPMTCKAGTVVAFSSRTLHRSGPNTTDRPRRAYLAQYSIEPIRDPKSGELKRYATPVAA